MIKVLDNSLKTLAILQNIVTPIIMEELNREFTFTFTTVIDNDKSNYVNYQNKIEVEDNYFNIVYTEHERTQDGVFINAQCEHVSYDLLSANFTAGFTATGRFSAIATTILAGTGFTVGTVAFTASQTISVLQSTNARQLLYTLASIFGGEIKWDKYSVDLLTQRGANRGVQFRYSKNISTAKRITDNRKKVNGLPYISYQISPAELEFELGFISSGLSNLEHYEIGDTVKVIDDDLGINADLRIYKESHDTEMRMQGQVEIANFVENVSDTFTKIQTTSVSKDNIYNGCSIGPDLGFVATRSDNFARAIMNATDGVKIQKGDGSGNNWTDAIFLDTSGNGTFTGFVLASTILSSEILIGTTSLATAPFSVTNSGSVTCFDLTLNGGVFHVGSGSQTFQFNTTDGLFLGSTSFATAPFSVTMSGALTSKSSIVEGLFTSVNSAGTTLLEASQDVNGGTLHINNGSGNRDVALGVSGVSGSNTGGTFFLYNNDINKPRIEMGILTATDNGIIEILDTNAKATIILNGNDGLNEGQILIFDSSTSSSSTLAPTIGTINGDIIATQTWVTSNFAKLGVQTSITSSASLTAHSHTQD